MTLAWLVARNGHAARIITRSPLEARRINAEHNAPRMPQLALPPHVVAASDVSAALAGADAVIIVVPSAHMRENARRIARHLDPSTPVLHATKGLEPATGKRMSTLLLEELPQLKDTGVAVLSGPNLASEIANGLPAATVIAGTDERQAQHLQQLLHSNTFRVYTSTDLVGIEFAGSLKNVVAIAAGIADGLGFGDNAKAGIITRALAEITRLGVTAGAAPATFSGLAGIGDVIATSYSALSRNRSFGESIARGSTVTDALGSSGGVVEGVNAIEAACVLADELGVDMPIARGLRSIVLDGATPDAIIAALLQREPARET